MLIRQVTGIWIPFHIYNIGRKSDKSILFTHALRDITSRKESEAALAASERRFRKFFENEPEYCYMVSPQGTILEANHAALKILGYTVEELAGKTLMTIYAPESHQRMQQLITLWQETGEIRDEEMVILSKNGDRRTVLLSASNVSDEDGEPLHSVSIQRDITERKEAEKALQESEERFRGIFEDSIIGMYRTSPDGRILMANTALVRMLGYSCFEELAQRNLEKEGYSPQYPRSVFKERIETEGRVIGLESDWVKKDGMILPIRESARVVRDEHSNTLYYEGTVEDITERKEAEEALRAERDKLKAFIDGINRAGIGFDIVGTDYQVLFQSKVLEDKFGKLHGKCCYEHYMAREEPCNRCPAAQAIKQKRAASAEQRRLDDRIYEVFSAPLPDEYGSVNRAIEIILDVTDRRQVEEAMKKSSIIIDSTTDAVVTTDVTGNITFWNKGAEIIYGYQKEEVIGKPISVLYKDEDSRVLETMIKDLLEEKVIPAIEATCIGKDQKDIEILLSLTTIKDKDGNITELVGITKDITERKKAEEELREQRDRVQKYLDIAGVMFVVLNTQENVVLVNKRGCEVLGYEESEILDRNWFDSFLPEPQRETVRRIFRKLFAGEIELIKYFENPVLTKGMRERIIAWNNIVLRDQDGNIIGTLSSGEDITERKEADKRIKEYQSKLKSLASELSLAEERERRRIAAGIHDDIAQKLAMAKFELQSLQTSVTDTDISGSLEKQCQLMDQVVSDARSLTFELSNPVLYQVGLEAAIESWLAERIQRQFGIECKFKSEGPRSFLEEDIRVVLFQAVRELLANVVKHANANKIEVSVTNTKDRLQIVVEDDGVGFDPTKTGLHLVGRGGFGLFNIRERLEYLGGGVKIESKRGKGTRVTMSVAIRTAVVAE